MPTKTRQWHEAELTTRLAARYGPPQHAFFAQLRNAAGFAANRVLDGMAMGLWPSRGLHVTGFEIKTTRGDWLRELKNPAKIEESGFQFCDFFMIVTPPGVVEEGELPPKWGLLETRGSGLRQVKDPNFLDARPFDRSMLAVILKRLHESSMVPAEIKVAEAAGYDRGLAENRGRVVRLEGDLALLQEDVEAFEAASGVRLRGWGGRAAIGDAVRAVMNGDRDVETLRRRLESLHETADRIARDVGARLEAAK